MNFGMIKKNTNYVECLFLAAVIKGKLSMASSYDHCRRFMMNGRAIKTKTRKFQRVLYSRGYYFCINFHFPQTTVNVQHYTGNIPVIYVIYIYIYLLMKYTYKYTCAQFYVRVS